MRHYSEFMASLIKTALIYVFFGSERVEAEKLREEYDELFV